MNIGVGKKYIMLIIFLICFSILSSGYVYAEGDESSDRPVIMLTGYWNPTGQMIARFSTDSDLNPDGWEGSNWEYLGYDIYSFFPNPETGYTGDFEVDYQDTWEDFWTITEQLHPVAIISFGKSIMTEWEVEYRSKNRDSWISDGEAPIYPTPNPPETDKPVNYIRYSTLPCEKIAKEVNKNTNYQGFVDWDGSPGNYLCGYMAYLDMWYQDIHKSPADPHTCYASGFIHVGGYIGLKQALKATNITLRETIKYLNEIMPPTDRLVADTYALSASSGGTVNFTLSTGGYNAYRNYILLGSASGTSPGSVLPGGLVTLPLNWDWFTDFIWQNLNTPVFSGFMGVIGEDGTATAQLNLGLLPSGYVGSKIYFAFALNNPWDFASNAVEITITR